MYYIYLDIPAKVEKQLSINQSIYKVFIKYYVDYIKRNYPYLYMR